MAIRKYDVDIKLYLNTNNIKTFTVRANSGRKARIVAQEKAMKEFKITSRRQAQVAGVRPHTDCTHSGRLGFHIQ